MILDMGWRVQQDDCKQLRGKDAAFTHRSSIFAPELQNPPKGYLLCRPQGRRDEEILCDECGNGSCRIEKPSAAVINNLKDQMTDPISMARNAVWI